MKEKKLSDELVKRIDGMVASMVTVGEVVAQVEESVDKCE